MNVQVTTPATCLVLTFHTEQQAGCSGELGRRRTLGLLVGALGGGHRNDVLQLTALQQVPDPIHLRSMLPFPSTCS